MEIRKYGNSFVLYDGIKFKSKLEVACYKVLKTSGLSFHYEKSTFTLIKGFKLVGGEYYAPNKQKSFHKVTRGLVSTTYTPDFQVYVDNFDIYFDVKGKANDTYPIKKKAFLKKLELNYELTGRRYLFFEPHTVKQMRICIEIIQ